MNPLPMAKLPPNTCKPNCGHCCGGTTPASKSEIERILTYLRTLPTKKLSKQLRFWNNDLRVCPFLKADKSCFVYESRPDVCVAFGHIKSALMCPYEPTGEVYFDPWPIERVRNYDIARASLENGQVMLMSLFGMTVLDALRGKPLAYLSADEYRRAHRIAVEHAARI